MAAVKTLTIDGKLVSAREDQTILEAAAKRGSRSRPSATSRASPTSAPAGSAWSRSAVHRRLLPACVTQGRRGNEGADQHGAAPGATGG